MEVSLGSLLRLASSDGRIVKEITLADDGNTLEISYTVDPAITTLCVRNGLSPNVLDLFESGQAHLAVTDTGGRLIASNTGGSQEVRASVDYADAGHTATLNSSATDGSVNSPRNHALTHMVEISGSGSFALGLTLEVMEAPGVAHGLLLR
jgi:hypothetical protein